MKPLDLSKILAKHKTGWIALSSSNKFVAAGDTLKKVLQQAEKKGVTNPTVFKSPRVKQYFAG